MEEKKNNKLGLGIIIGLLIAAVVGLGTYVVYDKFINNKDNETKENNKKENNTVEPTPTPASEEKELLLSNATVQRLIDTYNIEGKKHTVYNVGAKDVLTKKFHATDYLDKDAFYYDDKTTVNTLTAENKIYFAHYSICKKGIQVSSGKYTKEVLASTYRNMFGEEYDKTVASNVLHEVGDEYECFLLGDPTSVESLSCISATKATEGENYLKLYVKVAFLGSIDYNNYTLKSYSDIKRENLVESKNFSIGSECDGIDYKNSEKYPTYVYTFNKDSNGNYEFSSVEKVK